MSIFIPRLSAEAFLVAVRDLNVIAVQWSSEAGDLSFQSINEFLRREHVLRVARVGLNADISRDAVGLFALLQAGGLAGNSIAQVGKNFAAVVTALDGLRVKLNAVRRGVSGSDVLSVAQFSSGGETLFQIQATHFPAEVADPEIRQSAELAAVVSALAALGA